jgi:hypothetical protein
MRTLARMWWQLREETRRLEELKRERMRIEEEQRMEIVRQIKALESVPTDRCVVSTLMSVPTAIAVAASEPQP